MERHSAWGWWSRLTSGEADQQAEAAFFAGRERQVPAFRRAFFEYCGERSPIMSLAACPSCERSFFSCMNHEELLVFEAQHHLDFLIDALTLALSRGMDPADQARCSEEIRYHTNRMKKLIAELPCPVDTKKRLKALVQHHRMGAAKTPRC
jgi:hypothetical protein